jgi:hypothetical protein
MLLQGLLEAQNFSSCTGSAGKAIEIHPLVMLAKTKQL